MPLLLVILQAPALAMSIAVEEYIRSAWELWAAGGWAMIPLALNAFLLYAKCGDVFFALWIRNYRRNRYFGGRKVVSRLGGDHAASPTVFEAAQRYVNFHGITWKNDLSYDSIEAAFQELRTEEIPPIDRDLKFIQVAVAAAPLWGLLGTVTGMLTTFIGLAKGGGGEKTMNVIAGGISEALITTETGLMIALPGYFLHYVLTGRRNKFEAFIEHLQNACGQRVLKLAKVNSN